MHAKVKAAVVASLWLLLPVLTLLAQRSPSTFQGTWTATAGSAILHGTWSAQTTTAAPNAAGGAWLMTNASGGIVMEGTWSARKTTVAWRGAWSARARNGRTFSGSWDTPIADPRVKSFADLLQGAIDGQMSGGWRMGPAAGGWVLKGMKR